MKNEMCYGFMQIAGSSKCLEIRRHEYAYKRVKANWEQNHCNRTLPKIQQTDSLNKAARKNKHFFNIKRPIEVSNAFNTTPLLDSSTYGGNSHSSTYGCQKSGPLPREATVWAHARSRAMRMLR
jgi:hypothetical protein